MLKAVKHLSMNATLHEVLQNANALEILIRILEEQSSGPHSTVSRLNSPPLLPNVQYCIQQEISNHVFQTCYNLCRLNKSRQEEAAQAGIIPCLKRVIETSSPLKQFALPILCDLASAGKSCRTLLWQHQGLHMYLQLLGDPYFQVSGLESILSWLQDDTARVEDELLRYAEAIDALAKCFVNSKANSFENLLDPFLKIIRLSTPLTLAISKSPAFFKRIVDRLQGAGKAKAVVRLNLLKILRGVCDVHPNKAMLVERYGLLSVVERLSRDGGDGGAVLVRELAREIVPALKPSLRPSSSGAGANGHLPVRSRSTGAASMDLGASLNHSLSTSTSSQMSHQPNEREGNAHHHHHHHHHGRERKPWAPKRLRRAASEATGANVNNQNLNDSTSARDVSDLQGPTKNGLRGRYGSANKSGTGIIPSFSSRQKLGDILWQSAGDNSSGNLSEDVGRSGRWI
jgi:hypothetical protein